MCDARGNRGYFVFGCKRGVVDALLGSATDLPNYPDLEITEEVITLPREFMLGSTFNAFVVKKPGGWNMIVYIPFGARSLAL